MRRIFRASSEIPASLHFFGQKAIAAVDASREALGKLIARKHFREIIFTSGATEATISRFAAPWNIIKKHHSDVAHPRIIISSIEHESVFETAKALEQYGVEVIALPVNNEGVIEIVR